MAEQKDIGPRQQTFYIDVGGKQYPLAWTTGAQFLVDRELVTHNTIAECPKQLENGDYVLDEKTGKPKEFERRQMRVGDLWLMLVAGKVGFFEMTLFFWGMIEGGRRRVKPDDPAYSLEDAENLIDGAGGLEVVASQMTQAFIAARPRPPVRGAKKKKTGKHSKAMSTRKPTGRTSKK